MPQTMRGTVRASRSGRRNIGIVIAATLLLWPTVVDAQTPREPPTLRQRLVAGLQVRRPVEFAFIDAVIDTVERGELPQKLVDGFFFWSREKARVRPGRRGIIYFQFALETQANRLGINIRQDGASTSGP